MFRTIAAVAVAPIAPVILFAPVIALLHRSFEAVGPYLFIAVAYGYPAMVLFGGPLFVLYRKKQWKQWWQVALAGALVGAFIPTAILLGLGSPNSGNFSLETLFRFAQIAGTGAALGVGSGLAFWFIAMYGAHKHTVEP